MIAVIFPGGFITQYKDEIAEKFIARGLVKRISPAQIVEETIKRASNAPVEKIDKQIDKE
jgi:hypothetical protein